MRAPPPYAPLVNNPSQGFMRPPPPAAYPQQFPGAFPQHHPAAYQNPPVGAARMYEQQKAVLGEYPEQEPVGSYPQEKPAVVVQQPAVGRSPGVPFRELPVRTTCPWCKSEIVTSVTYKVGSLAVVFCLLMFCIGFWPCCLIPFCIQSCHDAVHNCPNCTREIGVYHRM